MLKVTDAKPTRQKRRWGKYRWLIVLIIVGNVLAARAFSPIMPHVQVPAEPLAGPFTLPLIGELYLTNTLTALFLADLILILIALSVRLATRKGELVLGGFAGAIEALVEGIYNLVESTAGKWTRQIFPWMTTIVLLVLVVNWMELIPGVDSVGTFHTPHAGLPAYETQTLFSIGDFDVSTITEEVEFEGGHGEDPAESADVHSDETHIEEVNAEEAHETEAEHTEGEHMESASVVGFTPWIRVTSTDLNFTVALALISVVMTQIIGLRALGPGYFSKFFAFRNFGRMWISENLGPFDVMMPFLDIFVGLLELVAEIAKIISFSFRLFGNIFAGSVLLFVIGSLVPVLVQSGFLLLEVMVGLIQALVFGMLTMVFMTMATQSHDDHDDHGEEHAEAHA
jgi:F-type H+-transporting ATPase subunit a